MFNRKYAVLLALITELVTLELVMIFGGAHLDKKMGWPGYGVMLGAGLGLGIWVFHLVIVMKKLMGEEED